MQVRLLVQSAALAQGSPALLSRQKPAMSHWPVPLLSPQLQVPLQHPTSRTQRWVLPGHTGVAQAPPLHCWPSPHTNPSGCPTQVGSGGGELPGFFFLCFLCFFASASLPRSPTPRSPSSTLRRVRVIVRRHSKASNRVRFTPASSAFTR